MFLWMRVSFFFFSSRRRHTRSKRDWSSDVCSSDLPPDTGRSLPGGTVPVREPGPCPRWLLARRARIPPGGSSRSLRAGGGGPFLLTAWFEGERDRVHAEPVTGRGLRRIVEHVAQVRPTVAAPHLGANHPHAAVLEEFDGVALGGLVEARPAAVRLELGGRAEQLGAAGAAVVHTHAVLMQQFTG